MTDGPVRLSDAELADALKKLPLWSSDGERLQRRIECKGFAEAFGLMTSIALVAQQLDHHPDWSNSWNAIEISLSTHSAGGVTALDLKLARRIDELAA